MRLARTAPALLAALLASACSSEPLAPPVVARTAEPVAASPPTASPLPRQKEPARLLRCESEGPAQSAPPLVGPAQIETLLASPLQPLGTRRTTSAWSSGRAWWLDTLAMLEEDGPDVEVVVPPSSTPPTPILRNSPPRKDPAAPTRWTLRWHDPTEIGGKARGVSIPAPADTTRSTRLRFAASSGARALFFLDRARPAMSMLVRALPNDKVELRDVSWDLLPTAEVAFAEDGSETIAWLNDTTLIVWNPGEPPRALASLAARVELRVGQPSREGVPVLQGSSDGWRMRVFSIPTFDAKAGARPPPPLPASLDGWSRVPLLDGEITALPVCAASAGGARFVLQRAALDAEIDGHGASATRVLYALRVSSTEACVSEISALLTPERAADPPAFVRADLAGKRAEGGDRGVSPAAVRRMRCALVAKP